MSKLSTIAYLVPCCAYAEHRLADSTLTDRKEFREKVWGKRLLAHVGADCFSMKKWNIKAASVGISLWECLDVRTMVILANMGNVKRLVELRGM